MCICLRAGNLSKGPDLHLDLRPLHVLHGTMARIYTKALLPPCQIKQNSDSCSISWWKIQNMLEFEHLQNNTNTFLDHLNSNKFRHDSPTPHRKSEKESDPDAHQDWPRGHGPHAGGSSDPWRRRSPQRGPPLRTAAAWHCGVRRGREGRRAQVRPSPNPPFFSGERGGRKAVGEWT